MRKVLSINENLIDVDQAKPYRSRSFITLINPLDIEETSTCG